MVAVPPELSLEDGLHERAQQQAVVGREEVNRPAHDAGPNDFATIEEVRERLGPKALEPGPEPGVRVVRDLSLQPDQVPDRVEDR